jgi:hypothetical protein
MILQSSRSSTQGLGWTYISVLQDADRTVITAAKVYKRRIVIKDYQIVARYSTTRTKIFFRKARGCESI